MKETKFAKLDPKQIEEINRLEEKLEVTLLAYDLLANERNTQHENNSDLINPS